VKDNPAPVQWVFMVALLVTTPRSEISVTRLMTLSSKEKKTEPGKVVKKPIVHRDLQDPEEAVSVRGKPRI
jgi:hypothetical protein